MNFQQRLNDIATQSIGFPSSKIALSQAVYSDLVLAKKYKDVEYKPISGLNSCVFLVQEPGSLEPLVILPILQEGLALSMKRIAAIFDLLCDSQIKDTAIE
ncbi:uncharacterized protein B0P05DRAFT_583732 [Gilbertella persicaria]|uniref:uncharacterized protein n=1 Tax=Gilbertella persicaria TaxID=101096 RepID=UPI00221F0BEF|nr:uncharacterized protein B0P05DRAFT_583732 [Gilbertella persicaria]KAI8091207.1 hypothetical protein B0P05DRAFT_583732 [Gilbertella persicaria]